MPPSPLFQPVESRVERAVFDLEYVVGGALDVLGDLMTVSRTEDQRSQNQHIQRALQKFDAFRRFLRHNLMVEILPP